MKFRLGLCLCIAASVLLARGSAAQTPSDQLSRLQWLAGCWSGTSAGNAVEENWMPLRGGTLVGAARAVRGDLTTSIELAVIRMRGDTLVFHAYPVGQQPAQFAVESLSDSVVAFANPAHDFPQRIIYRHVAADSLVARVEGSGTDGPQGLDYGMRRVACPGSEG